MLPVTPMSRRLSGDFSYFLALFFVSRYSRSSLSVA
jgi:hypothetical protein